jgi:hypothetical protein
MKTLALLTACLVCCLSASTLAQAPADRNESLWNQLDITQDGWLSGTEFTACGCSGADTNHDGEITHAEFLAYRTRLPWNSGATATPTSAPPQPAATATAAASPNCSVYTFSGPPVTYESFFSLWSTLSPDAAICLVRARGVSFKLTAADEQRINTGFTYPAVIAALRAAYRAPAPVQYNAARVTPGRYACGGMVSSATLGALRADLVIVDQGHYRSGIDAGTFSYNTQTRTLSFKNGPLSGHGWVGIYLPNGFPDATGYRMEGDTVVIRAMKDVQAGNQHELQACKRA